MGLELINQGKVDKTYQDLSQDMQKTIDRSTNEIKCSIGVDVATQDACSTISNGTEMKNMLLTKHFQGTG